MSLAEVVCDVSSIIVIFGPVPNFRSFSSICISLQHVTLPYHPLEIVELGVEHSGGRPRGGIGASGALCKLGGSVDVD